MCTDWFYWEGGAPPQQGGHQYLEPLSWGWSVWEPLRSNWFKFDEFLSLQRFFSGFLKRPLSPIACNLPGDTLWGSTHTTLPSAHYSCVLVTLCTQISRVMDNLRMEWEKGGGMYKELLSRVTLMSFRRRPMEFFLTWVKPEKGCS